MKLQNFKYICENCGKSYKCPELLGNPYGEFIMRCENGDMVYLYALSNSVFTEFSELLDKHSMMSGKTDMQRSNTLHKIFGYACDQSIHGTYYQITQDPACPHCGQIKIEHWGPTNPPEYIDLDIPEATHEHWKKLSKEEKVAVVDNALHELLNREKLQ